MVKDKETPPGVNPDLAVAQDGHIHILPPEEARRIAAGEVIDRPAALIREFLDNAIDAGASNIEVSIEEGGSKKVEVADDGKGMRREDLEVCWLDHATSKITSLDDLNTAETLGFRGEALAAAAAVARLEIISSTGKNFTTEEESKNQIKTPCFSVVDSSPVAWRLEVGPGESVPPCITGVSRTRGSTVRALNLYDTIPARKRFLKREGTEATLCRQVFIEKALAFPGITFRFIQDGRHKHFFPVASTKKERFASALLDSPEKNFLYEIYVTGNGFSAQVVIGGPELYRTDRRMLYIFANGRRIQDYSLITAMEYGTQGLFPNGTHPLGAVFVEIDPALADFNIHPAKREVRFRDPGAIHHAISTGLRDFCHNLGVKSGMASPSRVGASFAEGAPSTEGVALAGLALEIPDKAGRAPGHSGNFSFPAQEKSFQGIRDPIAAAHYLNSVVNHAAEPTPQYSMENTLRYVGKAFGFFIVVEWGSRLYFIDQHAAHERILFNRFLAAPIPRQELLIPISFNTESAEDDNFLEAKKEELFKLAIAIERDGDGWRIDALPEGWRLGDAETVREILALRTASENIAERWAATLCCHQALRDGDIVDDATAFALAKEALALPDPHCPHGRPIWAEISRDALCRTVRRPPG
jgi:DNA mismatch repair protein MutL